MGKNIKMRNKPTCLAKQVIARSTLFTVEQVDLTFSNGVSRTFERLASPRQGAVMIIPLLDDETVLLVQEYAAGTERYELGFPKGLMEAGEAPFCAANRELKEETGFGARTLHQLKTLSSSPAYFGMMMDLVVAQDLYPERLEGDEPEPIEVVHWPLNNLDTLLERDDFSEARSIAAIYLLKNFLNNRPS